MISNRTAYNIRVVNLSLGTPSLDTWTNDALCRKVQDLNYYGILVVAAAGNGGKDSTSRKLYGQIHSPGNDPSVLTVGATNSFGTDSRSDDVMASYSSHGPTRSFWTDGSGVKHYDNVIKPDMVAPGNKIIAAKARSTSSLISSNPLLTTRASTRRATKRHDVPQRHVDVSTDGFGSGGTAVPDESATDADDGEDGFGIHGTAAGGREHARTGCRSTEC